MAGLGLAVTLKGIIIAHKYIYFGFPASAPMFSFKTADDGWSPMTKTWFMSRCNEVWIAAGLPDMPGHSFHIGGATHLLLMGTPHSARPLEIPRLSRILEEDKINSPTLLILLWEL